jgi:hypothetical protein
MRAGQIAVPMHKLLRERERTARVNSISSRTATKMT